MYLKIEINGELDELMRKIWPNKTKDELYRDYENEYEWVWVALPEHRIFLNVSRAHDWGEEKDNYPTYVSGFSSDQEGSQRVDSIPSEISSLIAQTLGCKVFVHDGNYYIGQPEGELINVYESKTIQAAQKPLHFVPLDAPIGAPFSRALAAHRK